MLIDKGYGQQKLIFPLISLNFLRRYFMFKSANPYDSKRLTDENIQNYILSSHLNYDDVSLKSVNKIAIYPLLKEEFEQDQKNGVLFSIISCVYYYCLQHYDKNVIFNATKSLMNHYFYNPDEEKLLFFFIGIFYRRILKYFQIEKKVKSKYFKLLGFNFNTIKEQIDNKNPVIMYLASDGRNFYKHDAVTVIGYAQFNLLNSYLYPLVTKNRTKNMLLVYDHLSKKISYLDYDTISLFSCIAY